MATFNRENRSGGKPRFKSDRPDMHKATCARCGKICTVPFRPTGNKPVFCKDCFQSNQGSDTQRSENRHSGRFNSEDRQMYDAICTNCGKSCQIPFRPTQGRNVFCSRCFDMSNGSESRTSFERPNTNRPDNRSRSNDVPNYKAQFDALNEKMDKILHLLTQDSTIQPPLPSTDDTKVSEETENDSQEEKATAKEKKPKKTKTRTKKQPDTIESH